MGLDPELPGPGEQLELKGIARLYGEPMLHLPRDLYIPPDALEVFLDAFEGPLDLLLYLIRRQNFNILDIPMAEVTRQYLAYVEEIRSHHLELAAEYLLMAAMLIDIKSRMLLPIQHHQGEAEPEDPRAELARRLLEYEAIKQGAYQLDQLPQSGRDFLVTQIHLDHALTARLPQIHAEDLRAAWADIVRRAKLVQHHKITREALSVREVMTVVLRKLQQQRFSEFQDLFDVNK
ncbi:MAG: segregation/condensation protein A, partial [Betaproteobacteria bacterium]|nr:segregation/condensation protein A [Betaproteobacteria bacterium]